MENGRSKALDRELAELREQAARLAALNEITKVVASSLDINEVFRTFAAQLRKLVDHDRISITLVDEEEETVEIFALAQEDSTILPQGARLPLRASILARLVRDQRPLVRSDLQQEAMFVSDEVLLAGGFRAHLAVPLIAKGTLLGALNLASYRAGVYGEHALRIVEEIAPQVAVAVHHAHLFESERLKAKMLTTVHEVARQIASIFDLDQLLGETTRVIAESFGYHHVSVYLIDSLDNGLLYEAATSAGRFRHPRSYRLPVGTGVIGLAAATGQIQWVDHVDVAFTPPEHRHGPALAIPLRVGGRPIGVLSIESDGSHRFTADDAPFLQTLGGRIATSIENARLTTRMRDLAVAEERNRLARELHDDTVQSLAAISRQLDLLGYDLEDSGKARARLVRLQDMVDATMADVRRISRNLHPALLEDLGLGPALEALVADLGRQDGFDTQFNLIGLPERLPSTIELAVFRIVQEALNNVVRHAQAKHVRVELEFGSGELAITVADDGRGFEVPAQLGELARGGGMGTVGMAERVRSLSGTLTIESTPGAGTTVRVVVPVTWNHAAPVQVLSAEC